MNAYPHRTAAPGPRKSRCQTQRKFFKIAKRTQEAVENKRPAPWVTARTQQYPGALKAARDFRCFGSQFARFSVAELTARLRHIEDVDSFFRLGVHQHHFNVSAAPRNERRHIVKQPGPILRDHL